MEIIHKIAAVVIENNAFLMVRKVGKDVWTSLGGKLEKGETEEQALLREIKEEFNCDAEIVKKLGDPELEEYAFIDKNYKEKGIKLPASIEQQVIPYCVESRLLKW